MGNPATTTNWEEMASLIPEYLASQTGQGIAI